MSTPDLLAIEPEPLEPTRDFESFGRDHVRPGDRPLAEIVEFADRLGLRELNASERLRMVQLEGDAGFQAALVARQSGVPLRTEGERELEREMLAALQDRRGLADPEALRAKVVAGLRAAGKADLADQAAAAPLHRAHIAASRALGRHDLAQRQAALHTRHAP